MGRLLALSTLLVTSPNATANHVIAKLTSTSRPVTASHSSGPAVGPKPTSSATAITTAMLATVWITLPAT